MPQKINLPTALLFGAICSVLGMMLTAFALRHVWASRTVTPKTQTAAVTAPRTVPSKTFAVTVSVPPPTVLTVRQLSESSPEGDEDRRGGKHNKGRDKKGKGHGKNGKGHGHDEEGGDD